MLKNIHYSEWLQLQNLCISDSLINQAEKLSSFRIDAFVKWASFLLEDTIIREIYREGNCHNVESNKYFRITKLYNRSTYE